jgi:hypothetical protein
MDVAQHSQFIVSLLDPLWEGYKNATAHDSESLTMCLLQRLLLLLRVHLTHQLLA